MRIQTILKESEGKDLLSYCNKMHISISAFLRTIVCKELENAKAD